MARAWPAAPLRPASLPRQPAAWSATRRPAAWHACPQPHALQPVDLQSLTLLFTLQITKFAVVYSIGSILSMGR
jgi:hypothetical protein